ncbi:MAG TPA: MBL fold metallo-hydrolase [Acidimicrobiales bacterium]|nr:MBL fold metallo-hydrolase [Acidimicrobiales bacterium]
MNDEPVPILHEVPSAISPLIRRVVADNPGRMTGPGTNTYLVGIDEIAVIDPGPADDAHLDVVESCGGGLIRWIFVTHTHPDHSPGVAGLAERTGAEVVAFEARDGLEIDRSSTDGDVLSTSEYRLRTVHTPGHASNHLCFLLEEERTLFSGDHIMDGSTVVIAPPDGDMAIYLESLAKVAALRLRRIAPGHGFPIEDPKARIRHYIDHRLAREGQILDAVRSGTDEIEAIVADLYAETDEELHPVAAKSVHAHLLKLEVDGMVIADGDAWSVVA